jgi:hypothetical protein
MRYMPPGTLSDRCFWRLLPTACDGRGQSGGATDARGDLIYVAGSGMTLHTLAQALCDAGAVTAMQLDIHSRMVDMSAYSYDPAAQLTSAPLLPDVPGPPDRYLRPDQRDFIAITAR